MKYFRRRKRIRGKSFKERSGRITKHHIVAKARGGVCRDNNIIMLDGRRHEAFHLVFKNKTFIEAASLLIRANDLISGEKHRIIKDVTGGLK